MGKYDFYCSWEQQRDETCCNGLHSSQAYKWTPSRSNDFWIHKRLTVVDGSITERWAVHYQVGEESKCNLWMHITQVFSMYLGLYCMYVQHNLLIYLDQNGNMADHTCILINSIKFTNKSNESNWRNLDLLHIFQNSRRCPDSCQVVYPSTQRNKYKFLLNEYHDVFFSKWRVTWFWPKTFFL